MTAGFASNYLVSSLFFNTFYVMLQIQGKRAESYSSSLLYDTVNYILQIYFVVYFLSMIYGP